MPVAKAEEWARRGSTAVDARDLETAKKCFRRAAELDRRNPERRFHLALVLEALEEYGAAAQELTEALRIDSRLTQAARRLSSLLSRQISIGNAQLNPIGLRAALQHPDVSRDAIADAALRYLSSKEPMSGVFELGQTKGWEVAARNLCVKRTGSLLRDDLFIELLSSGIIKSPDLELLLTALRRILVLEVPSQRFSDANLVRFVVALMQQCFVNEYIWLASSEELNAITEQPIADGRLLDGDIDHGCNLLLASLYEPVNRRFATNVDVREVANIQPRPFGEAVARLVEERADEETHKLRIPRIAKVVNSTSLKVAAQYETAPYPRWTRLGMSQREGEMRRSLEAYFEAGKLAFMDHPYDVLVAGCGTGMDAVQIALGYGQNALVVALDLSMTSLAHASRMASRFGARNIEFKQGAIEEISKLPEYISRFRMIECGGVLHHMDDPLQGWRSLVECLTPGGIMRISLYSAIARSNLTALRNDPAYPGADCSDVQLRAFRRLLLTRPATQLGSELKGSPDFYTASGFRDLVLHVSEKCLTLAEIAGHLDELKLVFRGFQPPMFFDLLRRNYPNELWPGSLAHWAELEHEIPMLFAGMYKFWCAKA